MSTLLDEVLSDMNSAVPPQQQQQQDQYYDHQQEQQPQQQPPRHHKKRVHFEDESDEDDAGFVDTLKNSMDKYSLRVPTTVMIAVLIASLPQLNDMLDGLPYLADNWMASAAFKALVLAVIVYFMKLG